MSNSFSFSAGTAPLLISIPHDGRRLPGDIQSRMSDAGKSIPDTDWHVERLYKFASALGASTIVANFSRYVVDLNRPADDEVLYAGQTATGLCPAQTFSGDDIYADGGEVDATEKAERVRHYWRPYHDKIAATLAAIRDQYGYALLWDAHSIPSCVPRLFEGELPILNLGTWDGRSCDVAISDSVHAAARDSSYKSVLNARFKGGHITRHYGQPAQGVHAIQLEISQRAYMDEGTQQFDEDKARRLRATLEILLSAFLATAAGRHRAS